ncbi:MAG: hypothetical protein ACTSWD_04785 [Candidatus Heimdallarchaeota archaeon]
MIIDTREVRMEILKLKVEGVNPKRIEEGTIGFISEGKWYNMAGETETLKEIVKNVVAKGNLIEFEYNNGVVGSVKLIEAAPEGSNWHDDMTNFEDLLNDAHEKFPGTLEIKTKAVLDGTGNPCINLENKTAFFKATVIADNKEFTGHGDAEGITNDKIQPHFIRMAETRAIARALRWATNNAKVAVEETSEVPKDN